MFPTNPFFTLSPPYSFLMFMGVEKGCIGNEWINNTCLTLSRNSFVTLISKRQHLRRFENIHEKPQFQFLSIFHLCKTRSPLRTFLNTCNIDSPCLSFMDSLLLVHFCPVTHFYTPWKRQKTFWRFQGV